MQCCRNKQIIKVLKRNFYDVEPQPEEEKAEEIEKPWLALACLGIALCCGIAKRNKKQGILLRNNFKNNKNKVQGYSHITGYIREAK